jgi:hemolysin activation/secretion protein
MMKNYFKYTVCFFISTMQTLAFAADVLPSSAQPEQISRSLVTTTPEENTPSGGNFNLLFPNSPASALNVNAQNIKFQLNGIVLVGNKKFTYEQLSRIFEGDLHHTITFQRLLDIVQSITDVYRSQGYVSSRAILPVQTTHYGIVRIDIVEGKVDKVIVTGDPKKSASLVQKFGNRIADSDPLQAHDLEKYTLLANEIPGTQVHTIIKPSGNVNGASDLYMQTDHKNYAGYISYDNYRTRYIGPQQITADLEANSFLMPGDKGQLIFAKTPKGEELTFLNVNYGLALDSKGDRMLLGVIHDKTHPLFVLQPFDVDGTDNNYFTTVSFPIIRTTTQNLTLYLNANYENSNVTTFNQKLYTDQIRSLGFGASYNNIDQFLGVNSLYGDVRQGLPVLGYTIDTNPATSFTSRPGGHAVYTKIDFAMSRLQTVYKNLSLYALLKGQYGFEPLLVSEQFAYGGIEVGRGYDIAEMLGDRAIAGSLEARLDFHPNKFALSLVQPYIFYDFGKIWNITTVPGVPDNQSATSAGFGTRFYFNKYVSGNVTWAQPLTKQVAAEELIGDGRHPRTFFSIVASV